MTYVTAASGKLTGVTRRLLSGSEALLEGRYQYVKMEWHGTAALICTGFLEVGDCELTKLRLARVASIFVLRFCLRFSRRKS